MRSWLGRVRSRLPALAAMRTSPLADMLPPLRSAPERPDAAARRGSSIGKRNSSARNGCGNGGTPPPFAYRRRIDELGPLDKRDKQYRHQFRRAVAFLAYDAAQLSPIDLDVADGGTRDYRTTEARIAARLPPRRDGRAVSKRVASDALDRLRDVGLVDWDHGTAADLYDEKRRTLL